jgi:flagellar biogenesis protein FliO
MAAPGLVEVSSLATRVKIMFGGLTELAMAVLAASWLVRRMRLARRRANSRQFECSVKF